MGRAPVLFTRGSMLYFTISRIDTEWGIFRAAGAWQQGNAVTAQIIIDAIDIMGTDGWIALNLSSESVMNLIADLTAPILAHLQANRA